ncbi:peptide ABC transporter [Acuticoccus sediminis]|uniref:Peptide ABC transporter n=1 Tax=Acuticoccus sediminis TaxID=2184697 RepID=A0A8B2NPD8_9HYPH|nr:ABC transporter permease [Acuticoccus sediminis]RAI01756.1 peptide ABC transporter [Acuticoccus sediminis]
MIAYIIRRLLYVIPVLLIISLISFSLMQLVPGDPAIVVAGTSASNEEIERVREQLGLNQPFHVQLLTWYANLFRGDLGTSFLLGRDVVEVTLERLPVSLSIAIYALVLTLIFGIMLGIIAALRQNSWVDQAVMTVALIGVSLPNFWLGLILIVIFAVELGWLPTAGYVPFTEDIVGWLRSTTLPAVSLAMLQMGLLARITRSTMLEVLRQDYIRTARAKGLPEHVVVGKHALKNVMIPVITVIGIIFSVLLSGSVVIETIFSIPGVGSLLGSAILRRDYPVIQGGLLLVATMLLLLNLVIDVLYAYFDSRVRYDRD